jgi:Spy/CpxP family protein refolding chaperone
MVKGSSFRHTLVRAAIVSGSLASALAFVPGRTAFADEGHDSGGASTTPGGRGHEHGPGLLGEALKLDTLSPDQRAAIEGLIRQHRDARIPVRAADAKVLTTLAEQVGRSSIDHDALAPALQAERVAGVAEGTVERDVLGRLHTLLTPAQRSQLVDALDANKAHGEHRAHEGRGQRDAGWLGGHAMEGLSLTPEQKSQIAGNLRAERSTADEDSGRGPAARQDDRRRERRQALETFRGDSFDPAVVVRVEHRGERAEHLMRAMIPVLTPSQRAMVADRLRARAAHESRG